MTWGKMLSVTAIIILLTAEFSQAQKDTYVYGELQSAWNVDRDADSLQGQCFYGLGLKSCRLTNIYTGLIGAAYEATAVSLSSYNGSV